MAVESVDDMLVCRACGLMTGEYVHEETPICSECFNRLNWAYAQGSWVYVTRTGEKRHETPLCPAVQGTEWQMTRDEHVYLDLGYCKRCRSFWTFGFDHYRGEETVI